MRMAIVGWGRMVEVKGEGGAAIIGLVRNVWLGI